MKNVIKKIASIAMAFTLLGTGITVTKTISPKFDNTLVADAASCKHNCRPYVIEYMLLTRTSIKDGVHNYKVTYIKYTKCSKCNTNISTVEIEQQRSFKTKKDFGNKKEVYGNWADFVKKYGLYK